MSAIWEKVVSNASHIQLDFKWVICYTVDGEWDAD